MKRLLNLFLIGLLSAQGASLICYDPALEGIYQACAVKNGLNLTVFGTGFFRVNSLFPDFIVKLLSGAKICEPNRPVGKFFYTPNDEYYYAQEHYFEIIKLPQAWRISRSVRNVAVAVLDSGVQTDHPDLRQNLVLKAYNAYDDNEDVEDYDGHGTAVSGIIGAVGNNSRGIAGVAWQGRFLLTIKISHDQTVYLEPVVRAVNYILRNAKKFNIRVVNLSWGGYERSSILEQLIKKLLAANILVIAAAGNDAVDVRQHPLYPAAFKGVLSVASVAVDPEEGFIDLSDFSNYGNVSIAAPGTDVATTVPGSQYGAASGTSFAAPIVAGAAALYMSKHRGATAKQTFEALRISCTRMPELEDFVNSGCLLNVHKLLTTKPVKKRNGKKRGRRR